MPIDNRDWYKGNRSWHRKRKIKGIVKATIKAVVVILIIGLGISTALAYAGYEPFTSTKDKIIEYLPAPTTVTPSARTIWVEDITISPKQMGLRVVTVNLRASAIDFEEHSKIGCKVELWSGDYYYGYYRVTLNSKDALQLERSGINLLFPVPASEPVFQYGGKFSTKVSSNPRWADLPLVGLCDNPYKDFAELYGLL